MTYSKVLFHLQLTWGTPAVKREECSFKGKNLEVWSQILLQYLIFILQTIVQRSVLIPYQKFFRRAGSSGDCSFLCCLSATLLSCQLLYPGATSLSYVCVIQLWSVDFWKHTRQMLMLGIFLPTVFLCCFFFFFFIDSTGPSACVCVCVVKDSKASIDLHTLHHFVFFLT